MKSDPAVLAKLKYSKIRRFVEEPPIRIGGACIYLTDEYVRLPHINMRVTNVRNVSKVSGKDRHDWLWDIMDHNLKALREQVIALSLLPPVMRMWRISSELLPVATHPVTQSFYDQREVMDYLMVSLMWIGNYCRSHRIRLSFHPAQFVVLGSKNPGIRENAIRELIYHCDVFSMMGYDKWHQDGTSVNVHVGPKEAAVKEMRTLLRRSPPNILRFLTLENDEFSWGAQQIVDEFGDMVPVVLDIHHYWVMHEKRLRPDGLLSDQIRLTWRNIRPKLHHAQSMPQLCGMAPLDKVLSIKPMLDAGIKKSQLRIHSDHPWHDWSNEYAVSFGFDVMWEGKDKNQGALSIARQLELIPE